MLLHNWPHIYSVLFLIENSSTPDAEDLDVLQQRARARVLDVDPDGVAAVDVAVGDVPAHAVLVQDVGDVARARPAAADVVVDRHRRARRRRALRGGGRTGRGWRRHRSVSRR